MDWEKVGNDFREAAIKASIAFQGLNWAIEDMVESEVKEDAEKAIESIKKELDI